MPKHWMLSVLSMEIRKLASYRVDFWMRLFFSAACKILVSYYLWSAIFSEQSGTVVAGYSFASMILYFIVVSLLGNMIFSGIDKFSSDIYEGHLTKYLLYPVSFYNYRVASETAYTLLTLFQVIFGFALTIWLLGIPPDVTLSLGSLSLGLVAALLATYLYSLLHSLFELIAFWAENVFGLLVGLYLATNFLGGGILPLSSFPERFQTILSYTPFPYFLSFPANLLLGKEELSDAFFKFSVIVVWCLALNLLCILLWRKGLKNYTGVGI